MHGGSHASVQEMAITESHLTHAMKMKTGRLEHVLSVFTRGRLVRAIALVLLSASTPYLRAAVVNESVPAFVAGDRVCFIGDSITHSGFYSDDILLFYATRLPKARFDIFNCGISGDTALGAVRRFEWDIAVHRPTVATIMLGMNDVRRDLYDEMRTSSENRDQQRKAIELHAAKMERLATQLDALGCRIIFLTPSIYDQTAKLPEKNYLGVNDALAACAELDRALALRHNGSVVDFNGPMARINAEAQVKDPSFTITSSDRVHPGEPGHMVMTYLMLKAQGLPGTVAAVVVDAASGKWSGERCTLSNVATDGNTVSFDCLAESLPFPVGSRAIPALALVPFMSELNREPVTITGLDPGRYELLIDGQPVLEASADELSRGVDLAGNERTPQYRQAHRAKAIRDRRHDVISGRLRTIRAVEHFMINLAMDLTPSDQAAVDAFIGERLERARQEKKSYEAGQIETYQHWHPRLAELESEVAEATDALWKTCQPKIHHYLIRPKT
jgi:lysophospholipase L1-like esterase